jgi:hypothetical protein
VFCVLILLIVLFCDSSNIGTALLSVFCVLVLLILHILCSFIIGSVLLTIR